MIWLLPIALAVLAGFAWLLLSGRQEHRKTAETLAKFYALPESDARTWALRLLEQDGLFFCKPATSPLPAVALPPSVLEAFGRFEHIERHEFWVGRSALDQPSVLPGYTKIGGDSEFEEILVRADSTEIHLSYGPQHGDEPPETMPSMWHKLILASDVPLNLM